MLRRCGDCDRVYDDAGQLTICPHAPLWAPPGAYCPRCDVVLGVTYNATVCPCGQVTLRP